MFYKNKITVWVFVPSQDNPMSATDLIVYSHLAYKSRYSGKLIHSRIAWSTGVCRQTVTSVLDNLKQFGLLKNDIPQHKPEWFMYRSQNEKETDPHWTQTIQYWKCLVRMENSPLTLVDTMVFSYLLKRFLAKQFPKSWTCTYVANALCVDPRTVGKSLKRLEEHQLFQIDEDSNWRIPECLVGEQNMWFRRKEQVVAGNGELKTFVPFSDKVSLQWKRKNKTTEMQKQTDNSQMQRRKWVMLFSQDLVLKKANPQNANNSWST